ncbi:MAG: proton-conducting transporter membrane subunit [Bacteroidales bacterium]|nr:proton-conducting transporter membrane subunit [Bacteroidales bacterium]
MKALIPIFVMLPLASAFLIPLVASHIKGFDRYFTSLIMLVLAILSISAFSYSSDFPFVYKIGGWEPINGIPIGIYFVVDGLSVLMLGIITVIGFLAAFYSISYISQFTGEKYYYALFCLMVAGMNGVVISGDLFNMFVFLEISVIASYALVAFGIEKEELEASFKYQVLGGLASLLIVLGIAMLYWQTKTLNLADISKVLTGVNNNAYLWFTQLLLVSGFGLKAAMIPFHAWLPDAHSSAPAPISAMLSGVLIKAIGIYSIMRLFFNMFALSELLAWLVIVLGALSMIIGVFLAIGQWDFKRLLAYHSISQMGYVVLGLGLGMLIIVQGGDRKIAVLAISGGLFHMVNHAVFKGLLFLNAGAVEFRTGTRKLQEMGGLSESMPITSATSLSASMAISGIPPFNGFFSKLMIIVAAVLAGQYLLALIAVIVSIITLASFMKVQKYAFYGSSIKMAAKKIKEVPFFMLFSMIVLAVLCLLLSLVAFPGIRDIVLTPAVESLINTGNYSLPILGY